MILVVDDDPIAHDILEGFLFQENYHLVFARSGAEALALLNDLAVDIILLDVMMPDLDGFEVCRRIKSNEKWRHLPVILITALGSKTDLARGFEAGADDFLHKPVSDIELRARVRAMLRLKKQYDELQATLRLREDLAHMIVHDMRSPLSTILGYSELILLRDELSFESSEDVRRIHTQAVSLNSFLNDMLLLAKMEANQLLLHHSTVDVVGLIKLVQQNYNVVAELKKIRLVLDLPDKSVPSCLDSALFHRVIDNLLSNAIKFSPSGSTVTIRVEYPRQKDGAQSNRPQLRLEVIDEGPGIPEEHQQRIFDKFEIVAMSQKDGTTQIGLGLAFCKMVTEAHGGRIFVRPNQPAGSIFTVEIL